MNEINYEFIEKIKKVLTALFVKKKNKYMSLIKYNWTIRIIYKININKNKNKKWL
jgi:hypothetical protein